jgi:hypothetical protein
MTPEEVLRFARQIALPEVGPDGQARICAAHVLLIGGGIVADTAAQYLRAGGIGGVVAREVPPTDGAAWAEAMAGIDLVLRVGFDDDAMLGAAARLGLPVIAVRAEATRVDLLSFPRRAPTPDAALEIPPRSAAPSESGAAGVLAGALAATAALTRITGVDDDADRIRHLRFPLDGSPPVTQRIRPN